MQRQKNDVPTNKTEKTTETNLIGKEACLTFRILCVIINAVSEKTTLLCVGILSDTKYEQEIETIMKDTTLVIMAAGMGSRYGGVKQIDPIGPDGEIILDFSAYDAVHAGFNKIVFIIRRDIEKDFREVTRRKIEKMVDVEYVFQDMENIPAPFTVPEGRVKPWGTGHAVYCARNAVKTPFALINADDYYGQKSFRKLHDRLITDENDMYMVSFELGKTLTENGTVSRGVCTVENGYLKGVTEKTALDKNSGLALDTPVSMNMWGLRTNIFDRVEKDFSAFLAKLENPLKDEFYIPFVIDDMIHEGEARVKVLPTDEQWYGVTYKEDKAGIVAAMKKLIDNGLYEGL